MKRYISGIVTLLVFAAVLVGTVWRGRPGTRGGVHRPAAGRAALVVSTGRPVRRDFSVRIDWFGTVAATKSVRVVSPAAARVMAIRVTEGDSVRKGDLLISLGGPLVQRTLSAMAQRVAALEKQESVVRSLVQTRREAVADKLAKREELLSAEERLAQIEGDLGTARGKLAAFRDSLQVRAAMDGVFVNRRVSPGQDVQKGAPLGDLISPDLRVTARLFLPDGVSPAGKQAVIHTASGAVLTGTVSRVLPQRTAGGAAVAWIEGRDIDEKLKAGEHVFGRLLLETRKARIAVPREAVLQDETGRSIVFVKTPGGYEEKTVRAGIEENGWCEILSGLSDRDEVVVRGAYELFYRNFAKTYKVAD